MAANSVEQNYAAEGLAARIAAALEAEGLGDTTLTPDILAMMDQLHTRGMPATVDQADMVGFTADTRVLDLGCGIGGPARYLAATYGCRVIGIDLTPDYVEAGRMLTERSGLADLVDIRQGNALDLPFEDASFDVVWSQNVIMNVADKDAVYAEVRRVLVPGGRFTFTDYLQGPGGPAIYPTVWARDESASFIVTEAAMRAALEGAGFRIEDFVDDGAAYHGDGARIQAARTDPSKRLTSRLVLGDDVGQRMKNAAQNVDEKRLVYVKVLARRVD